VNPTKTVLAALASAALFLLLAASILPALGAGAPSPTSPNWLGEALWSERSLDLAIQSFILLTGVLVIVLLLREERGGSRP